MPRYFSSRCGVWNKSCSPRRMRQLDKFLERDDFVFRAFVQADFADSQHVGLIEKLGQQGNHFPGEARRFRPLWIHAQPGIVAHAVIGRAPRLPFGELAKVVVEAGGRSAVVAHPEGRLGDGHATRAGHRFQVVGGARGDVDMRIEEVHGSGGSSGEGFGDLHLGLRAWVLGLGV